MYLLIMAMTLPLVVLIGLTDSYLLILVSTAFAFLHFSTQPLENHIISAYTPPTLVSSAYGVKFASAFSLGSFASAFSGYITDHFHISYVFPALGVVLLISILPVSALAWIDR
jgi:hypothetical protein